jgi:hypothetical protein
MKTNSLINNTPSRYPMIDEHGVREVKRNIFKSNWDAKFYNKYISNKLIN